jgi:hypothetical protein
MELIIYFSSCWGCYPKKALLKSELSNQIAGEIE